MSQPVLPIIATLAEDLHSDTRRPPADRLTLLGTVPPPRPAAADRRVKAA